MNKIFIISILILGFCLPGHTTPLPDLQFQTLNHQPYPLVPNQAKILFFFNTENLNTPDISIIPEVLRPVHQLGYAFQTSPIKMIIVYSDIETPPEFLENLKTLAEKYTWKFDICYDPGRQMTVLELEQTPAFVVVDKKNQICYRQEKMEEYRVLRQYAQVALGQIAPEHVALSQPGSYTPDWANSKTLTQVLQASVVTVPPITPDTPIPTLPPVTPDTPIATVPPITPDTPIPTVPSITPDTPVIPTLPVTTTALPPVPTTPTSLAPIASPNPWGTAPQLWGWVHSWEDSIFFGFVDFLVNLTPILIWGWGFLFAWKKSKEYSRMRWAWIACFGFAVWYFALLILKTPTEFIWLSTILQTTQHWIRIGYQTIVPYHGEQAIIVGLSLMLVMGLRNEAKEETK